MEIKENQPLYSDRLLIWHPNQRVRDITQRLRVIEREFSSSVRWATVTGAGASINALFVLDSIPSPIDLVNVFVAVVGFALMASYAGAVLRYNTEAAGLNSALATYLLNENKPVLPL